MQSRLSYVLYCLCDIFFYLKFFKGHTSSEKEQISNFGRASASNILNSARAVSIYVYAFLERFVFE